MTVRQRFWSAGMPGTWRSTTASGLISTTFASNSSEPTQLGGGGAAHLGGHSRWECEDRDRPRENDHSGRLDLLDRSLEQARHALRGGSYPTCLTSVPVRQVSHELVLARLTDSRLELVPERVRASRASRIGPK